MLLVLDFVDKCCRAGVPKCRYTLLTSVSSVAVPYSCGLINVIINALEVAHETF